MTDLRQIADEIELKIHLGTMEARDAWRALKPRLVELERQFDATGKRIGKAIDTRSRFSRRRCARSVTT